MKKKKVIIGIAIASVALLAAIFLFRRLFGDTTTYSQKRVPVSEVEIQLSAVTGIWQEADGTYLTYGELEALLEKIHLKDYITYKQKDNIRKVTQKEWNAIYGQILDYLDTDKQVAQKELMILSVDNKEKKVYTSEGTFELKGKLLRAEDFVSYRVYVKGGEFLGIADNRSQKITLLNAYLKDMKKGKMTVLFDKREYPIQVDKKQQDLKPCVCDFVFEKGEVKEIRKKEASIEGRLIRMDAQKIEIEGYGQVPLSERVPVYRDYNRIEEVSMKDIVLDNMKVSYIVGEGKVQALLLHEAAKIQNVRVLLLNQDSPYYDELRISSDTDFTVYRNQEQTACQAGQAVSAKEWIGDSTEAVLRIEPAAERTAYPVKEDGTPLTLGYSGSLEIRKTDKGYTLVNIVDFERYICGVLPSEMPDSFESEALKAQAVCARSYAYIQLTKGEYAALGAHVDDSTNYQVYNKNACSQKMKEAVNATCAEGLEYRDKVVEAYYFSTSCGHTGDMNSWNKGTQDGYGYLQGIWVRENQGGGSLADEQTFRAYISGEDETAYERQSPYYRWSARLDFQRKEEALCTQLEKMYQNAPENVSFTSEGEEKKSMKGFGALRGISVAERGESGVILSLKIGYENGDVLLKNEYNIRKVLGCGLTEVVCKNGTKHTEMTVLPSAYCFFEYDAASMQATVIGGGFGHGIGMSQYGADAMAKQGMSYRQILEFYYRDVQLETLY